MSTHGPSPGGSNVALALTLMTFPSRVTSQLLPRNSEHGSHPSNPTPRTVGASAPTLETQAVAPETMIGSSSLSQAADDKTKAKMNELKEMKVMLRTRQPISAAVGASTGVAAEHGSVTASPARQSSGIRPRPAGPDVGWRRSASSSATRRLGAYSAYVLATVASASSLTRTTRWAGNLSRIPSA